MSWQFLTTEVVGSGTDQASAFQPVLAPEASLETQKEAEDALWAALPYKDTASLRVALPSLPNLDFKNDWGETPLHQAVNQAVNIEFAEMLSILLEHPGANVAAGVYNQQRGISDITPLHHAASTGRLIAIRILLQHGADLEARDSHGQTPLLSAVQVLGDESRNLMLSLGANPNVRVKLPGSTSGWTPVHFAVARYTDSEPLRTILAYPGVDPNIRDAKDNTALFYAAQRDEIDKVSLLLRHPDINPNRRGEEGRTPLYISAIWGFTEIVKALLAHPDIDPNIQDDKGRTPYQVAGGWGRYEIKDEFRNHPDFEG